MVVDLIARSEASVAAARRDIATLTGPALLDFVRTDLQELRRILFDRRSHQVYMSAMDATLVAQRAAGRVAGRAERG